MNHYILIVGAGGIGSLLGLQLQRAGYRVQYLRRLEHDQTISENSSSITRTCTIMLDGQRQQFDQQMVTAQRLREGRERLAAIFWATKAYDYVDRVEPVLNAVQEQLSPGCLFVPLCNGYVEEYGRKLAEHYSSRLTVRLGFCNFGVTRISERCYRSFIGEGRVNLGPVDLNEKNQQKSFEKELLARVPLITWQNNILALLRRKWVFNVVINSLCAANHLPNNGALLERMEEVRQVFEETYSLAQLIFDEFPFSKDELFQPLQQLIQTTASNKNSMVQDIEQNRAKGSRRTENDFLAGVAHNYPGKFPHLEDLSYKISSVTDP